MNYLTGPVVGINFHDQETGYSILRVKNSGDGSFCSVKGYFYNAPGSLGRFIKAIGKSTEDGSFKADVIYPPALEKVTPHLEDLFDGKAYRSLSPWLLKRLKDKLQDNWQKALLGGSDPFKDVIPEGKKKDSAVRAWRSISAKLRPYAILRNLGFSHRQAMNTVDSLGSRADHKFFRRPYLLKLVSGVGFEKVDEIAQGIGVNPNSLHRKQQHLTNILERLENQGNTFIDLNRASHLLARHIEMAPDEIENLIRTKGVMDYRMYQLPEIGRFAAKASTVAMAKEISEHVDRLSKGTDTSGFRFPQKVSDFDLDPLQEKAIRNSCLSGLSIITGGPGTGKTTIIREVVHAINANEPDSKIAYCALSGKAARRLSESTGEVALTINSLLEMKPGARPGFDQSKLLEIDTLVVDELSMVDEPMFLDLLRAIPDHCRVILVGDVDQLPSIGFGAVLKDLIESNVLSSTKLLKSNRFDGDSSIGKAAKAFNDGHIPDFSELSGNEFTWTPMSSINSISDEVVHQVKHLINEGVSSDDIQILTPQVGSAAGTERLNRLLKPLMNKSASGAGLNVFGTTFHVGDRIMQSGDNDYEINFLNGDVGVISAINLNPPPGQEKSVAIKFKEDREDIEVPLSKMGSVKHSFAMTIHKSQGSEYDAVVMPICKEHQFMMDKQMVYTAITRAKTRVRMIGDVNSLKKSLKQSPRKIRNTLLALAIRKKMAGSKPKRRIPEDPPYVSP